MKKLKAGKFETLVDDDVGELIEGKLLTSHANKNARYVMVNERPVYLHRLIMGLKHGDERVVDHINGNALDNRRENLRVCLRGENSINRRKRPTKSGYRGVQKIINTYEARIQSRRAGDIYIGRFATAEEAARAYDAKAREVYGDYAPLNFPEDTSVASV